MRFICSVLTFSHKLEKFQGLRQNIFEFNWFLFQLSSNYPSHLMLLNV